MSEAANYRAGAASVVITPRESTWLAGLAVRTTPSRGTINDLRAKALVIEDAAGERLVIVTMDLIAVRPQIASAVTAEVSRRHGLSRERLLFAASHTRYGPEVRPDKVEFFKIPPEYAARIEPYVAELIPKLVDLIGRAIRNFVPARLT